MEELLLDACVIINIAASGIPLGELASHNQSAFAMVRVAAREALYIRAIDDRKRREPIDVADHARRGDLTLVDLRHDELPTFVDLARHLDDGEAASLAVAIHRRLPLATDDRKARRLAEASTPAVELVTTSGLLRGWASDQGGPEGRVSDALRSVEIRASFVPGRNDPHRDWWMRARRMN